MKKFKAYYKEIVDMENLELRTGDEWREEGTVEEAAKLAEYRVRKVKNNALGTLVGIGIGGAIVAYSIAMEKRNVN